MVGDILKTCVCGDESEGEYRHEQCVDCRHSEEHLHCEGKSSLPVVPLNGVESGWRHFITGSAVASESNHRSNRSDQVEEDDDIHIPEGVIEPVVSLVLYVHEDARVDEEEDESSHASDAQQIGSPEGARDGDIGALEG